MDQKVFLDYIEDLCKSKKTEKSDFLKKLVSCGAPGTTGTTVSLKSCEFVLILVQQFFFHTSESCRHGCNRSVDRHQ